jgi:hypothetical protein
MPCLLQEPLSTKRRTTVSGCSPLDFVEDVSLVHVGVVDLLGEAVTAPNIARLAQSPQVVLTRLPVSRPRNDVVDV